MNFEIPKLAWIKAVMLACKKANGEFLDHKYPWIKLQHNGDKGAKFESEDDAGNKLIGVVMLVRM